MVKRLLALTMLLLAAWGLKAQLPPPCPSNNFPPADLCSDICIYCNFNGIMSSTSGYTGQTPPGFCGTIENEQWLGFIAGAPAATFTASPSNCIGGNGIQIALYTDCNSNPIACNGGSAGGGMTPVSITTQLTPGVNYFLLIDGYAGDQCDFDITVVPPSAVQAPSVGPAGFIQGPTLICPGATVTFTVPTVFGAGAYTWDAPPGSLINGMPPPVQLSAPSGNTVEITFGSSGGQICVTPANSCSDGFPSCINVTVQPIPPTILPPVVICNEDLPYTLPWGDYANQSGLYETTFISYLGCDSVVRQQLVVKPPIITYLPPQTVCAGTCITVCGEEYCEGGSYSTVCESYQGCDSLINFTILVLEPIAEIIANGVLSCDNDTIVLTTTPSPGTKIWKDLDGMILGTGNSLVVTEPGTIILTVTAAAGGSYCIENDTIEVTGNTTPPTVSATGGVIGCGNAQAQLNTVTNALDSTFLWSPANGLSATNIPDPIATVPGTYTVIVTDGTNGCTNSATVEVTGNTDPPSAAATGGVLTCVVDSIGLTATTDAQTPTFSWGGPSGFSSIEQNPMAGAAGTYTVTITNTFNNCTATATASITLDDVAPMATAVGGNISCTTPSVPLAGSSPTPGVSYSWTGPNGFTSMQQNPNADTAGVYTLTVLNPVNGCTSIASATVTGDTIAPNASASGGTVSCAMPNLTLSGSSSTNNVTYSWTGPNNFSSTDQNPSVTDPGVYTLTVTAQNDCTQTATATVDGDFATPDAAATGGVITCTANSTTINGTSNTPNVTFSWVGPSGGMFSGPMPTVSNVGDYTLIVTATNGCTQTATTSVIQDAGVPNASAAGGTLNCNIDSVMLDGGSITPGVILSWTGPAGFTSGDEDPVVTVPGTYTLQVSDPNNGCTAIATADVLLDDAEPGATATGGTVTCAMPDLDLTGDSPANNVTWAWTGPGGFSSPDQNPNTTMPGDYSLIVTGDNGCTSTAMTTVLADQTLPVPASTTGILTCDLTTLTLNGSADVPVTYAWTGPNNFSSADQNPDVTLPGDYTLAVTATNGCVDSVTITVDQDIAAPDISATGNTISCTNPQVPINGASVTPGVVFAWVGPNSFNSDQPDPVVDQNGAYTLTLTAPNGCTSETTVDVVLDTEEPSVIAQVTGILTCATTSIDIATTATNASSPIQSFAWTGPNGYTSSDEDPIVDAPGTYTVLVTSENGCTTEVTADVSQDIAEPDVSATADTLTCLVTQVLIDGSSTTPSATFEWQGPAAYSSNLEDPTVDTQGDYTLTVTGPNGCTASTTISVILDGDFPDAVAVSSNNLDCDEPSSTLTGTSTTMDVTYTWTDTSGMIVGVTPEIMVTEPGVYQLAVTALNGCVTNANVAITQDIVAPGATAVGDTIDCISGQTPVLGDSPTSSVVWTWTGPNNFMSDEQSPVVSQAGIYTLTVTGLNACTSTAEAFVEENTQSPVVVVDGAGTLTCLVTDLTLNGSILTTGAVGVWTDPNDVVVSTVDTVDVSTPGIYTFTVTAQNGCISAPTLTVDQNIETPQDVAVTGGLINCTMPTLPLTATTSTTNASFQWTGPNAFSSSEQNPVIDASGTYTLLITNDDNGCQATAVTNVTEDFVEPDIDVTTDIITCSLPTVTLEATTLTPGVTFSWTGPGIDVSNETLEDPQVTVAGNYSVVLTAQNGCTSVFAIDVNDDVVAPDISTSGVTLTCTQPTNNITGTSQTAGVTYAWTGPNGFTSTTPSPTVSEVGDYVLTVTAPNGCTSTSVAVVLPDASLPTVSATGGTLTCNITDIQIAGTSNNANVTWQWSGPTGFSSTDQNPIVTAPGSYNVVVTAPNGCTASTSVDVLADTDGPNVLTGVPDQLNCTTTQVDLSAGVQDPGSYTYQWSTLDGNIVSGEFSQNPVVSVAALYTVVVTDQANGCTTIENVDVVVDSTTISGAVLNIRDVTCFGKTDGIVGVASVVGGTSPFLYSFDDLPFVSASFFSSLAPGTHSLVIQDANGCEWETSIDILEPEELLVNLGQDTIIPLGHSIQLSLSNTVNYPDRVASLVLDPSSMDSVFCDTCSGLLWPLNSFRYFVTVVDSNGCEATDSRTIVVDKTRYVYIPNIFDPEASDNDAIFYISGDTRQIRNIKSLLMFDRWGNAVFEQHDFQPNDPSKGWDGTVRGEKANPGVFVYYTEIEFIDNETILYKGDVTLVRN